jgi:TetR/AcrR family transcriptional regulator, transcriptional repressor for nem operon
MLPLKDRIIHEALRQFSRKGFMSTSISDILESVGTSKGGLYNHFKSKEDLFSAALSEARKIWRQRNLAGLDHFQRPLGKLKRILENYRDHYLADLETFPGGCVFVTLAVELHDQQPHLAREVTEGFNRFKAMVTRLLEQEQAANNLRPGVDPGMAAEIIFSGLLGACVSYISDRSKENLDHTIEGLIGFLTMISR